MRRAPGIVKGFTQLLRRVPGFLRRFGFETHRPEAHKYDEKADRVDEKTKPFTGDADDESGERRSYDAGSVEEGGIEADGGRNIPAGHEVGDERLTNGNLQRAENAKEQSLHENPLDGNQAAKSQYAEDGRLN